MYYKLLHVYFFSQRAFFLIPAMAAAAPAMALECEMRRGDSRSVQCEMCGEEYIQVKRCPVAEAQTRCPKCRPTKQDMPTCRCVAENLIPDVPISWSASGSADDEHIDLKEQKDAEATPADAAAAANDKDEQKNEDEQTEQNGDTQVESTRAEAAAAPADPTVGGARLP